MNELMNDDDKLTRGALFLATFVSSRTLQLDALHSIGLLWYRMLCSRAITLFI